MGHNVSDASGNKLLDIDRYITKILQINTNSSCEHEVEHRPLTRALLLLWKDDEDLVFCNDNPQNAD